MSRDLRIRWGRGAGIWLIAGGLRQVEFFSFARDRVSTGRDRATAVIRTGWASQTGGSLDGRRFGRRGPTYSDGAEDLGSCWGGRGQFDDSATTREFAQVDCWRLGALPVPDPLCLSERLAFSE